MSAVHFGGEPERGGGNRGSMLSKRPRERSPVWEHFEETPDRERAICKHCGDSLSAKSTGGSTSTTDLERHIQTCSDHHGACFKVRKLGVTEDKSREIEVKKAVLAEITFAPSDCKNAYYNLNCAMEMDIEKSIYAYYEHEKGKLVTEIANLTSGVAITFNVMKEAGFISLTAHFINDDFNLVKKLIGFKKITDVSSESIASTIQSCISDWRLAVRGKKIYATHHYDDLVLDALSNLDSVSPIPSYKHFMTAHCTDALKPFLQEPIKIFEFIKTVGTTKHKMDELNQIAKLQGLPPLNLGLFPIDLVQFIKLTQPKPPYEAVLEILEYSFRYKQVFCEYAPKEEADSMFLSQINWERFELLLNLFWLVNDAINELSSFKSPTVNLSVQCLLKFRDCISGSEFGSGYNFESAVMIFLFSSVPGIACVLDPRCKLFPFEYIEAMHELTIMKGIRETIHKALRELFDEFSKLETNRVSHHPHIGTAGTTNTQDEGSSTSNNLTHASRMQNVDSFSMYMSQKLKRTPTTSELDEYLNKKVVEVEDGNFDLLAWWKENKSRYPVLSRMARDILAVPASVYDVSEHITSDLRRLEGVDPQLVEAVICSKDWIISSCQRTAD